MPTLTRSSDLLGDPEVCDVYVDAVKQIENLGFDLSKYQFMVALQPDHPDSDSPVDQLLEYAYENKYDDLFTVSSDIVRTGSVRILRMKHLIPGYVSRRVGCYKDDATNINSLDDLQNASNRILASS